MKSIQVSPLTGNGLSNLQRICAALKLLQPPTNNSYSNILKRVVEASCSEAHECLIRADKHLKRKLIKSYPQYSSLDVSDSFNISASVDGTWQKQYGSDSLLGVVFIIPVESGEVLNAKQGNTEIKIVTVIKVICHMKLYAVLLINHHPSQWKKLQP